MTRTYWSRESEQRRAEVPDQATCTCPGNRVRMSAQDVCRRMEVWVTPDRRFVVFLGHAMS